MSHPPNCRHRLGSATSITPICVHTLSRCLILLMPDRLSSRGERQLADFASIAEAAERKNVHYQTVRRVIARGALRATRVGRAVIIASEDLERWRPHYERAHRSHTGDGNREKLRGTPWSSSRRS